MYRSIESGDMEKNDSDNRVNGFDVTVVYNKEEDLDLQERDAPTS